MHQASNAPRISKQNRSTSSLSDFATTVGSITSAPAPASSTAEFGPDKSITGQSTEQRSGLQSLLRAGQVDPQGVRSVKRAEGHLRWALENLNEATARARSTGQSTGQVMSPDEAGCNGVLASLLKQALRETIDPSSSAVEALDDMDDCIRQLTEHVEGALRTLGEGTWLQQALLPMTSVLRLAQQEVERAKKAVGDREV